MTITVLLPLFSSSHIDNSGDDKMKTEKQIRELLDKTINMLSFEEDIYKSVILIAEKMILLWVLTGSE